MRPIMKMMILVDDDSAAVSEVVVGIVLDTSDIKVDDENDVGRTFNNVDDADCDEFIIVDVVLLVVIMGWIEKALHDQTSICFIDDINNSIVESITIILLDKVITSIFFFLVFLLCLDQRYQLAS